jgi:hypothetical protein
LLAVGVVAAGFLFAVAPRRWALSAVPIAVAAFLLISSGSVFATVTWLSRATRHAGNLQSDPAWIDHAVGKSARVEVIDTSDILDPHVVWQAEFWNRSVRRLFGLSAQDPSIPDVSARLAAGGRIEPGLPAGSPDLDPGYVVGDSNLDIDGTRVASGGQLALWRVHRPLRLGSMTSGITPDGWTGPFATYTRFVVPPRASHVEIRLSRPNVPTTLPAAHVRASMGPTGKRTVWQRADATFRGKAMLRFPVRRPAFQIRLSVSPTFSPAQFGSPDTRTLGVVVSFKVR